MGELLTVRDLCRIFKVVDRTIYRWIQENKFPHAFRLGKGHYVPASDVARLRKKQAEEASKPPPTRRSSPGFVNRWRT